MDLSWICLRFFRYRSVRHRFVRCKLTFVRYRYRFLPSKHADGLQDVFKTYLAGKSFNINLVNFFYRDIMLSLVRCTSVFLQARLPTRTDVHLKGFCVHRISCTKNYNLWRPVEGMSWRRLHNVFSVTISSLSRLLEDVLKISSKMRNWNAEDVFKTFSRYEMPLRRLWDRQRALDRANKSQNNHRLCTKMRVLFLFGDIKQITYCWWKKNTNDSRTQGMVFQVINISCLNVFVILIVIIINIFIFIKIFFHGHWWFTGRQGKGYDRLLFHSATSTCSQTFRHLFEILHMRWLSLWPTKYTAAYVTFEGQS